MGSVISHRLKEGELGSISLYQIVAQSGDTDKISEELFTVRCPANSKVYRSYRVCRLGEVEFCTRDVHMSIGNHVQRANRDFSSSLSHLCTRQPICLSLLGHIHIGESVLSSHCSYDSIRPS